VSIGTRAAGDGWKLLKAHAPWPARSGHTSVIDAAGNIYVLGGGDERTTSYGDVWRTA
jgi:hypothetical protein